MITTAAHLLGRALAPIIRPALRWLDTAVVPALDIDWDDLGDAPAEHFPACNDRCSSGSHYLMAWEFPGDES